VTGPDEEVNVLAAKYREVLLEMDSRRIESGEKPRSWNRLVNRMQALQLQLRSTQAGRDAITSLIGDGAVLVGGQRTRLGRECCSC
jgi:hypothetical protein